MTLIAFLHILPTTTTLCRYACIPSSQVAPTIYNQRGSPRGNRRRLGEVTASNSAGAIRGIYGKVKPTADIAISAEPKDLEGHDW